MGNMSKSHKKAAEVIRLPCSGNNGGGQTEKPPGLGRAA